MRDSVVSTPSANASMVEKLPVGPAMEPLEPRQLFSVSVKSGVLEVKGATAADIIRISRTGSSIRVTMGGTTSTFSAGAVDSVRVRALGGNDSIRNSSNLRVPINIFGGDGNDTILGSPGSDRIKAGAGTDSLRGGG